MTEKPFDSRLLSIHPFVPHDYADLIRQKAFPSERVTSETQYAITVGKFHALADVKVDRIVYRVDGLKVTGVMALPAALTPKAHPLLIFNRGGNGELGKLTAGQILRYLVPFAREGFCVFASNYRGNDGGEGQDEFGGADTQDVLELLNIAMQHPAWDGKNAYMLGISRGGLMTYLAIKHGAKLQAAATIAAPSDLRKLTAGRPEITQAYFEGRRDAAYEHRSAVRWAGQLDVPLLLLHGESDERVTPDHTLALAHALSKAGKVHKAIRYPGDDHFLSRNGKEALREILLWFAAHRSG